MTKKINISINMTSKINRTLENDIKLLSGINDIKSHYPRIVESLIPVSKTGISALTYFHWKKMGLVDFDDEEADERRSWVRLNLYQFVWIKIIQLLREFGLPLNLIKKAKDYVFMDMIDTYKSNRENIVQAFTSEANFNTEQLMAVNRLLDRLIAIEDTPVELAIIKTQIYGLVNSLLISKIEAYLFICKIENEFEVIFMTDISLKEYKKQSAEYLKQPHIQIPIRPLIEEFLSEPANAKIIKTYGFFKPDELRVLDAIRRNEFKKITIRFKDKERQQMIIEETIDHDIRDQKAKDIFRIIGKKEFTEIDLKMRNNQHIFARITNKL